MRCLSQWTTTGYAETRSPLNPITLPLRDIYSVLPVGIGANTYTFGSQTGRWENIQGVDCNPGIVTFTYDENGNDSAIYYETITLISGYGGTYVFQKFEFG